MVLTFKSSTPESFVLVGHDTDGSTRVARATRADGNKWDMRLEHPSGRNWNAQFYGPNVLDALAELLNDKDVEYRQEKARGHQPEPEVRDPNRRLDEFGNDIAAPIFRSGRDNRG